MSVQDVIVRAADGRRFVTVTWAGVINGWTLMNNAHPVTANNAACSFGQNLLEGVSTCFMLRKIAERADIQTLRTDRNG